MHKRVPARMTVDEFLVWDAEDASGRRWQLIDGEPALMAPAAEPHGAIQAEMARLLGNHLAERGSPCRVIAAPGIVPRVRANENFRVPDLGVTCAPPSREVMVQDPVLLIEILSPSNESETRANVWTYTTIPSVREILAGPQHADRGRTAAPGRRWHMAGATRHDHPIRCELEAGERGLQRAAVGVMYRTTGSRPE